MPRRIRWGRNKTPKGEDKDDLPGATVIKGTPTEGLGKEPL